MLLILVFLPKAKRLSKIAVNNRSVPSFTNGLFNGFINDMRGTIELIKNRSDIGAGTRGSDLGIDAMEIAAINKENHFFQKYPYVDIPTRNESIYGADESLFAKHIKEIYQQCKQVASTVEDSLLMQNFPLVLSGDHSSAIGTISGVKSAFSRQTLGVIWIDAHADIHSPYTTPSGNMHGMPLAAVMQQDNLSCRIHNPEEDILTFWQKLKKIGADGPKLEPRHLIYFGVRDTEEPENLLIKQLGIKNYKVEEVREKGLKASVSDALARLSDCDKLYVSFDVDSMDSELIADGTGTPVPRGFVPSEIMLILQDIFRSGKVACMEIAEVNPLLDHQGNRMAEVAFDILEQITHSIEENL